LIELPPLGEGEKTSNEAIVKKLVVLASYRHEMEKDEWGAAMNHALHMSQEAG